MKRLEEIGTVIIYVASFGCLLAIMVAVTYASIREILR